MRRFFVVWLSVLIAFSGAFISFNPGETAGEKSQSAEPLAPSSPIRINSNIQFAAYASSGDGNSGTPWVIDNLEIEAAGFGYAIYIGNTTDHFRIIHCSFSNASGGSGSPYFTNTGVTLFNVVNGNVTNNTMNGNVGNGIYLNNSNWCQFTLNDITMNGYGLKSDNGTHNNTIYHNNFLINTVQAYDDGSNVWNLTSPIGGNYWSDWTNPDNNFDGFVDNIYSVPGGGESGDIPAGYYDAAAGKVGDDLKDALHIIIRNHTEKSYDNLWTILPESDEDPNNSDNFILLYTGRSIPKTSVYPDWNREHVWAKSHGDFSETPPAGTDAHHLRPSDVSVNSDRGNLDFDNGGVQNSEATECYSDSDSWEPRDAVKGDIARMMFYMATRYDGDSWDNVGLDLELVDYVPTSGSIFGKLSTLLEWHINDPVDDIDRHRNEIVYSNQNNRNPFIDHPEYVDSIWGSGNPPVTGGGGGTNRDYLPFASQEGWNAPPGPVHNIDQGTDHHMIQWAIDNATSGDRIMVDDGTYFENVVIDVPVTITATAGNVIIDGGGSGTVVEILANGVELSGFEIVNGGALATDCGIKLNNVDLCNIEDNNITGVYNGIFLTSGCDNNTLENNTIFTTELGMNVQGSWNTIFHNNFLTNTNHTKDAGLNTWDMGYPVGGNFFDNWTTPDANIDGFVDDPFIIPTGGGGGVPLDLEGYRIEQYDSTKTTTIPPAMSIEPGGYLIIARDSTKSTFETHFGITLGSNVLYLDNADPISSKGTAPALNGDETYELYDDTNTLLDGQTGQPFTSGTCQRISANHDGSLATSWVISADADITATPGSGINGDETAGLVISEYAEPSVTGCEFVELYYDSPSSGGVVSNNQDNWPFTTENSWISAPLPSYAISLEQGWNMVSVPWKQVDTSITSVLSSIDGKWDRVATYNDTLMNPWLTYGLDRSPSLNDAFGLDSNMGFWINVTNLDVTLYVYGASEPSTTINLKIGWNLVGYPSGTDRLASTTLPGSVDIISVFNKTQPSLIRDETDLSSVTMAAGNAYWVHVNANVDWVVDW
ncbi:MAG: endonuclease [Thermoplasmata archaeon]|nr:endonuclease [Thermoplasmata archaeon]